MINLRPRKSGRQLSDDLNSWKQQNWRSRPISAPPCHPPLTSALQPHFSPLGGPTNDSQLLSFTASQLPDVGGLISSIPLVVDSFCFYLEKNISQRRFVAIICHCCTTYAKIAGIVCLQNFSCLRWPLGLQTHTAGCAQLGMECGNSNSDPHTFKASTLPAKLSPLTSSRQCQHPRCTTFIQSKSQKEGLPRLLSHSHRSFTPHLHNPHPSTAEVLMAVLCDSAGPNPTVLCLPLPVCFLLYPAHFPRCRGPVKLTGSKAFAFHFPGLFRSHLQFF